MCVCERAGYPPTLRWAVDVGGVKCGEPRLCVCVQLPLDVIKHLTAMTTSQLPAALRDMQGVRAQVSS